MLNPDSAWRLDFFRLLAELSDELLPSEYRASLGPDSDPATHTSWESFDLPLNARTADQLAAPVETIVNHASERGLLSEVTAEDLFALLLGRPWGRTESWVTDVPMKRALAVILMSPEYSRSLPWIAKSLIDRGQWNYFVHIPKTAGSHFQAMLWGHFGAGSLLRAFHDDEQGVSHPWVTSAWLRRLLDDDSPDLWVSGHLELKDLRPVHSIWTSDRVFTLVREPFEQVASAVNYFARLREERPDGARRYISAMWGGDVPQDLNSLNLDDVVLAVAKRDVRLRPSYFFDEDVLDAAISQHVVVGFQENLRDLLGLVVGDEELRLPPDVVEDKVRVNRSPAAISVDGLSPQIVAEVARLSRDAVVDYHTLRRLAGGAPYVYYAQPR